MNNPLIDFLQLIRLIDKEDQLIIGDAFTRRIVSEGECLSDPGSINRNLFFICGGVLRIVKQNEKGNPVIHFFLKGNQFCTILRSFTEGTIAEESIEAACDAEVMAISKSQLMALYEKLPFIKVMIDETIQATLLEKINIRNRYLGLDSATKYRLFLTTQSDIALKISLSDIASYLGITPQSLSRIRRNISHSSADKK
jgi:CRP/FNR family transcriptional regulator, anaerobic regulatory protein